MSKKPTKSAAQMDREIRVALGRPLRKSTRMHHAAKREGAKVVDQFLDLVQDDDPYSMLVAEDLLLANERKIRDATGGRGASNFTIDMKPLHWRGQRRPKYEVKRVEVSIDPKTKYRRDHLVKFDIRNGPVHFIYQYESPDGYDELRKAAIATAWAVAKAIKPLPQDTDQKTVEETVFEVMDRGKANMIPEELF